MICFKVSTKYFDKNILNMHSFFPIDQIKNLYTNQFENITKFSNFVYIYNIYQMATLVQIPLVSFFSIEWELAGVRTAEK